jgi:hypothetical protein
VEGGGIEHDGPDGGVPQEVQDEIRGDTTGDIDCRGDEAGGLEGDEEFGVCAPVLPGRICSGRRWKLEKK